LNQSDRPLILITNDDGVASPGLRAAIQAVGDLGEIWVVAPKQQQSGMARSLPESDGIVYEWTLDQVAEHVQVLTLDTSPAGVVLYAVSVLLPDKPDLTISGINYGENLGSGVTTSGTIGAALEAASWGIPSLAVSLETEPEHHFSHSEEVDFSTAAWLVRRLTQAILAQPLPQGVDILKVDVPSEATPETPWRLTRVSRQRYFFPTRRETLEGAYDKGPLGYKVRINEEELEPDSDIQAMARDGVVSIAPMTLDLTAHGHQDTLRAMLGVLDSE
jgi:5'-nucleotidase